MILPSRSAEHTARPGHSSDLGTQDRLRQVSVTLFRDEHIDTTTCRASVVEIGDAQRG